MMLDEESVQKVSSELEALYELSLRNIQVGEIVKGKVISVRGREVVIDIGFKSEGTLPMEEFSGEDAPQVGQDVDVFLESQEDDEGRVVLSKRKADRLKCWNTVLEEAREGGTVEGRIFKKVRGGFMVDIGMEAFLPASLVSLKPTKNLDQFLGQVSKFKIVKMNARRKNIVLSRKDFLESERATQKAEMLKNLQEGQRIKGRVKNITDFGAFIDLGGIDGLLHITDMSWGRLGHPSEVVSVGEEREVLVIGFDRETQRISLGLKQLLENPWQRSDEKYPINSRVKGKVVNLLPYGAFVELERGIEGLIHVSEMSWTRRVNHPGELLAVGQEVEAVVLNIDKDAQKIALGLKQTQSNPWDHIGDFIREGDVAKGLVRNLTDYGAFVDLECGLGGLIHISDMSWVRKVNHPSELLKKAQDLQVRVLNIDSTQQKISLGLKQLEEDPWPRLVGAYEIGQEVDAKVRKATGFGLFLELPNGLEGLAHITEIPGADPKRLAAQYPESSALRVRIIRIESDARKIGLSFKGVSSGEPAS